MSDMCGRVHEFADGELGADTAGSFRWHLASCNGCQLELESILALRALALEGLGALARALTETRPGTAPPDPRLNVRANGQPNVIDPKTRAASRATMEVEAVPPLRNRILRLGRSSRITYAVLPVMAAASVVGLWLGRGGPPIVVDDPADDPVVNAGFAELAAGARPTAERFAYAAADRWRPPAPVMRGGEAVRPLPTEAAARLEERDDQHGLVVLWMIAGEWDRAEAMLQRLPGSPELDNERAVLDMHRGRWDLAERRLQSVVRARPQLRAARWNLALLYQRRGELDRARQAYIELAARGEPGWAAEARQRAAELAPAHR